MKTDIDPIFEHRESKEFRKEFFTGLAVVIVAAFFLALLLLAIAYGELIDGVPPLVVIAGIFTCFGAYWILSSFLKDFKHRDQR
jgi:phosphatidylserine synthase